MTLDVFYTYLDAAVKTKMNERKQFIGDVAAAVGSAFAKDTGKALRELFKHMDEDDT